MEDPILNIGEDYCFRTNDDFDIALLGETVTRLSQLTPLHESINEVVRFVTTLVRCDSCMVYVLEEDELVLRASKNPHPEVVDRLKLKVGEGITGWVAEHLEPVVIGAGAYLDDRFRLFNELPEDRFEAFMSVPVVSGGRLVGVINVQNRARHRYSDREVRIIAAIGFLVGAEIERARLASENLALVDRLASRTFIDRAKGILQRDLIITEEHAYRMMQRESQDRCKSMREIAEAVILADSMGLHFN